MEANTTTGIVMNKYTVKFFANCPNNGVRVEYTLTITVRKTIQVETLIDAISGYDNWYHEDIADNLSNKFNGQQVLTAFHHGVFIETIRDYPNTKP